MKDGNRSEIALILDMNPPSDSQLFNSFSKTFERGTTEKSFLGLEYPFFEIPTRYRAKLLK